MTRFDIGIHLYENKNQVLSYADNSALKGHGYLDFHPRESLHIKWPYLNEGESSNGRLFLQTDEDVGGIKLNIGWISFCMSRLSLPEDSSPEVVEGMLFLSVFIFKRCQLLLNLKHGRIRK